MHITDILDTQNVPVDWFHFLFSICLDPFAAFNSVGRSKSKHPAGEFATTT